MASNPAQERSVYSVSWFGLSIFFIQIFTILILVPSSWLVSIADKEAAMLVDAFGDETAAYILDTGYAWYENTFVHTGINAYVESFFLPTAEEVERSVGMESLGQSGWFPWLEGRGQALSMVLILFFERLSQLVLWAPFLGIMFVPSAWDGYMAWKMKYYSFAYSSPMFHRFSIKTITLFFSLSVVGILLPLPIPPLILPLTGLILVPAIAVALFANLPKRI